METHADLFDAVEWSYFWTGGLNFNARAARWANEQGKPVVGNSDLHDLRQLGRTYSLVDAERSADAVCAAIRAGRVSLRRRRFPGWSWRRCWAECSGADERRRRRRRRARHDLSLRALRLTIRSLISSMSNTSMPCGASGLSCVGERRRNPEPPLLPFHHHLHALVHPGITPSRPNVDGSLSRDRTVEHLAVGRPAGVVHRDPRVRPWMSRAAAR